MKNEEKILEIKECGAFFRINRNGELICLPNCNNEVLTMGIKLNWGVVEDFHSVIVDKVNDFYGTSFVANIE